MWIGNKDDKKKNNGPRYKVINKTHFKGSKN